MKSRKQTVKHKDRGTILIVYQVDVKVQSITRDNAEYSIMTKSQFMGKTTIINVCIPNDRASKHMIQNGQK